MTEPLPGAALAIPDAASGLDIPPSLQASLDRHRAHLGQLAATLQAAGLPAAQIEASVTTLVVSYRSELIHVLKSLMKDEHDAE
jgi:hypothetical protein